MRKKKTELSANRFNLAHVLRGSASGHSHWLVLSTGYGRPQTALFLHNS